MENTGKGPEGQGQELPKYTIGQGIRVQRSDGRIESGWTYAGKFADGKIRAINKIDQVKGVDPELFESLNGPIRVGSLVKVKRNNGLVDDGWVVTNHHGTPEEPLFTVQKKHQNKDGKTEIMQKTIPQAEMESTNK